MHKINPKVFCPNFGVHFTIFSLFILHFKDSNAAMLSSDLEYSSSFTTFAKINGNSHKTIIS